MDNEALAKLHGLDLKLQILAGVVGVISIIFGVLLESNPHLGLAVAVLGAFMPYAIVNIISTAAASHRFAAQEQYLQNLASILDRMCALQGVMRHLLNAEGFLFHVGKETFLSTISSIEANDSKQLKLNVHDTAFLAQSALWSMAASEQQKWRDHGSRRRLRAYANHIGPIPAWDRTMQAVRENIRNQERCVEAGGTVTRIFQGDRAWHELTPDEKETIKYMNERGIRAIYTQNTQTDGRDYSIFLDDRGEEKSFPDFRILVAMEWDYHHSRRGYQVIRSVRVTSEDSEARKILDRWSDIVPSIKELDCPRCAEGGCQRSGRDAKQYAHARLSKMLLFNDNREWICPYYGAPIALT